MSAVLGGFTAVSARLASLAAAGGWSALHAASLPGLVAAAALAGGASQSVITLGGGQLRRALTRAPTEPLACPIGVVDIESVT
jgi:hypothetical protein